MNQIETQSDWGFDLEMLFVEPEEDVAKNVLTLSVVGSDQVVLDQSEFFANETTSLFLSEIDWNQTFSGLDYLLAMQLCACVSHSGISGEFGYDSLGMDIASIGLFEDHGGHDHCDTPSCGGDIDKNGFCEKCGKLFVKVKL